MAYGSVHRALSGLEKDLVDGIMLTFTQNIDSAALNVAIHPERHRRSTNSLVCAVVGSEDQPRHHTANEQGNVVMHESRHTGVPDVVVLTIGVES